VQQGSRLPAGVEVLVRPVSASVLREQLPPILLFTLLTAIAAYLGVMTSGTESGVWLGVGLLCAVGVVVQLLVARSLVGLGPALAADADHVWVRAGGFLRPRSVRLDWAEITGIGLRTWRGRRRATARYLTIALTDAATAALTSMHGKHTRRLTATFGAPLAVSEQHKATSLDETVRGLRALAPDHVRFTDD
jgi:hypothetical protein